MKSKKLHLLVSFIIAGFLFISSFKPLSKPEPETVKILISTDFGPIKIKLYNETPVHRDNFIRLVEEHFYDSLLFHRIIQNFVIQGGDPDSKRALPSTKLGDCGPGYTLPAEFHPHLFHKKGALAAARNGDYENPSKASSGSQFFIVQGAVYKDYMLKLPAERITKMKLFNEIIQRPENKVWLEKYQHYSTTEELDSLRTVNEYIMKQVNIELPNVPHYQFSEEQVLAYTTVGGTPHLDENYTVFGEVTEGLAIIDKMAKEPVDKNGRPLTNISMKISILKD